eukprot:SAG25_NODE_8959_length_394_cov_2.613559_1_plen_44_part_01
MAHGCGNPITKLELRGTDEGGFPCLRVKGPDPDFGVVVAYLAHT